MSDRLTLSRALEEGGIPRDAAKHIATEILDTIHDNVATKTDLAAGRSKRKADIAAFRSGLKADIAAFRSGLKADIAAFRSELKADIAALRAEIALVEHRLMTRLGGAIAVAVGIILAAVRFLPHG
jgi:hypothetical protein